MDIKNHLPLRIISFLWLGTLAYLFIAASAWFNFSHPSYLLLLTISLCFACYGYLFAYRVLLLPAEQINLVPIYTVTTVWAGSFTYFLLLIFDYSQWIHLPIVIFTSLSAILFFMFCWRVLFCLFQWPFVVYPNAWPSLAQRIVATFLFGGMGAMLNFKESTASFSWFIFLFAAYLGFSYGYRIFLLPTSWKGLMKSIMLGFIGSSYALIIVFLLLCSSQFLKFQFSLPFLIDALSGVIIFLTAIFPLFAVFICSFTIVFSILMYLFSRIGR